MQGVTAGQTQTTLPGLVPIRGQARTPVPHHTPPYQLPLPSLGLLIEFAPYQLAEKKRSEDAAAHGEQEEGGEVVGTAGV